MVFEPEHAEVAVCAIVEEDGAQEHHHHIAFEQGGSGLLKAFILSHLSIGLLHVGFEAWGVGGKVFEFTEVDAFSLLKQVTRGL